MVNSGINSTIVKKTDLAATCIATREETEEPFFALQSERSLKMPDLNPASSTTKSACLEARVDLCDLATLAIYYHSLGATRLTKSGLAASAVHDLATALVSNGLVAQVTGFEQALAVLEKLLENPASLLKKVRKETMKQLKLETPVLREPQQDVSQQQELHFQESNSSVSSTSSQTFIDHQGAPPPAFNQVTVEEVMKRLQQSMVAETRANGSVIQTSEKGGEKSEDNS